MVRHAFANSSCNRLQQLKHWSWPIHTTHLKEPQKQEFTWNVFKRKMSLAAWRTQLCHCQRWVCISIRIVHKCVETLIHPLPKDDCRYGSIELKHSACNEHTARHLKTHPSKDILLFARIWMKCRLVQFLCEYYLFTRRASWLLAKSIRNKLKKKNRV